MLEEQEEADAEELKDLNKNSFKPRRPLPGDKSPERPFASRQIPTEVYMRRKELLDDVQAVLDIVEPGLSRRRGIVNCDIYSPDLLRLSIILRLNHSEYLIFLYFFIKAYHCLSKRLVISS